MRPGPADAAARVKLFEAVVRQHAFSQPVGREANSFGPLALDSNVGGHDLEVQRGIRLDKPHHATEPAFTVLGTLIGRVGEVAFDMVLAQLRLGPLMRFPVLTPNKLRECGPENTDSPFRPIITP